MRKGRKRQTKKRMVAAKRDQKTGRFTRCYNPVMRTVYKEQHPHDYQAAPGQFGRAFAYQWDVDPALEKGAPYDREGMKALRDKGGARALLESFYPPINPERLQVMLSKRGLAKGQPVRSGVVSVLHAKQRIAEKLEIPQLVTPQDRGDKRYKRREKRKIRVAKRAGNLKALLARLRQQR